MAQPNYLATAITNGTPVPVDARARPLLEQVGIDAAATASAEAVTALRAAGDRMLILATRFDT